MVCIVISYYAQSGYASKVERFLALVVVLFLMYLMVFSLSREIILTLVLVAILSLFRYLTFMRAVTMISLVSLCLYIGLSSIPIQGSAWDTKIYQTVNARDLNDLSSGRLELQRIAVEQLLHSPLAGTGFHGYELAMAHEDLTGWSTHVYYLTVIWKMGLLGALVFFVFLSKIIKNSLDYSFRTFPEAAKLYSILLCAFLIVMNMLWDVLLAPSIMCLFAFFVGSMCRVDQNSTAVGNPAIAFAE